MMVRNGAEYNLVPKAALKSQRSLRDNSISKSDTYLMKWRFPMTAAESPAPDNAAPMLEKKREKAKRFAKEGASLLGVALAKTSSRTLWWGGWGGVLGVWLFIGWWAFGGFTQPWPRLEPWLSLFFFVIYLLGGIAALGYAGFWRGLGRFTLFIGIERGLAVYLLDQILTRVFGILHKSNRVSGALEASEDFFENLPLERWEVALKKGVGVYLADEDKVFQATGLRAFVSRHIRSFVSRKIALLLLARVRAEVSASGGGGVSMKRVQAVAYEEAEDLFGSAVLGAMNGNTLLSVAVLGFGSAVAPMLCYGLLHWQQGQDLMTTALGIAMMLVPVVAIVGLYGLGTKLGIIPEGKIGG
jgi:hypothetical protein